MAHQILFQNQGIRVFMNACQRLMPAKRACIWALCCLLPAWLGAQITPQGSFSGNTICPGAAAQLTFTATLGTGPFTVRYTDGNAIRTQPGVVSGVAFNAVSNTTATKTYTLLKVTGSDAGVRSSGFSDATAQVTVRPRPDLQSLALTPIAPVCAGSDAVLKLNGFVQAQSFETQTAISTSANGASSVHAADLDGDGDMDVLSAFAFDDKIAWHKNDGSGGFAAQPAISTSAVGPFSVHVADLDGDGDMDVLSASAFDDKIAWYKNDGSGVFAAQPAISTMADGARSVRAADLDGDGDMDVLSASAFDDKIAWYKNDGSGVFTAQPAISTSAVGARSVHASDLDGDGDMDVLSASNNDDKIAWYKNDGSGAFTAQAAISTSADAAQSVYAADLDGDGDMDVLSASANDDKIAWYKNDGSGVFTAQAAISTTATGASSVYAADLDGDGDMDVLSALFSDGKIAWYKNNGSGVFTEQAAISTTANGASSVHTTDLDGDGDMDVLSASANDDKIAWYKNRTPYSGSATITYTAGGGEPQSATVPVSMGMATYTLPAPKAGALNAIISASAGGCAASVSETANLRQLPRPDLQDLSIAPIAPVCPGSDATLKLNGFVQAQSFEAQTAISTSADGAVSVYSADLDGDGDMDVLSASFFDDKIAWYKNNGSGGFTAQPDISTSADGARMVHAADLDGDGDMDVLSASQLDDKIAWYKNDGSGGFTAQPDISTSVDAAWSVYAADLDSDGVMDVLSASSLDDKIAWYKNDGSGVFTAQPDISTSADGARMVHAADLDSDGDMDVLSASVLDAKIAWYKNDGSGVFTAQPAISTSAVGASSVHAADLDGDGDMDVLSASQNDDKIAWYKNDGSGGFAAQPAISTSADGAWSVYSADLDDDGNMDVLLASFFDDKITWYKNDGSGVFTAQPAISTSADGARSVYAADLDGDGDMDVLSASENDEKIAWYKNLTPFSSSASVMYDINGGASQTTSGTVSMGVASLTIPAPSAGALTVTKVTNADGCSATTSKATGVSFLTPPTFSACPAMPLTANTAPGLCTANVNYTATATGDPNPALTYVLTGATTGSGSGTGSGGAFNMGMTTVTLTATNSCGATSCTFAVTVNDTQNPSIVCPNNIVSNTDAGQCTAMVTYPAPVVGDNCPAWTLTRTWGLASGSNFTIGVNMVQWQVSDVGGNTAVCQFTVTVSDAQPPTIVCPANMVRSTDANLCTAVVNYAMPTANDNCGVGGIALQSAANTASGSIFPKGTTLVVWKAADTATPTANTATCSFTVTVNDNQQPAITCPSNFIRNNDAGLCTAVATYTTPIYSDNCAGGGASLQSGLPSGSVFPKGQTTVVWRATDAAGLTRTCSFRVTVNDVENPIIICPANQLVNTAANACTALVTYAVPTATDNCPGPLTLARVSGPASGSTFPLGNTHVMWRAIDAAGRSSSCSFSVEVSDVTPPAVSCPGNITVGASAGQCAAVVTYLAPTTADNCGVQSSFLLSGLPSGSSFPAGITTIVWKAIDVNGQSATCSFTVKVNCGMQQSSEVEVWYPERAQGWVPETSSPPFPTFNFSLFPNPAVSEVQVLAEGLREEGGELMLLDTQGRLMWRQRMDSAFSPAHPLTRSLLDIPAGVYFVTLQAEGQKVTKRLVVARL